MASLLNVFDLAGVLLAVWLVRKVATRQKHFGRLPPGPKPLPVVGNVYQIPKQFEYVQYAEWAKQYGTYSYCFG